MRNIPMSLRGIMALAAVVSVRSFSKSAHWPGLV
jgi:hypothetical protein